jgi:ABC-2 type transport system ATP-binding protein
MATTTRRGDRRPVIQASGLTKRYGSFTAADAVDFTVYSGDIFGFLGPNGAGKSTTIGMLLGLIKPTAGDIRLFDLPPAKQREGLSNVGGIIDAPTFYPYLSGRDNLLALANLRPGITAQRVDEVLELVGLDDAATKKFGKYSMGMKQRLGIAWTLLHDPDLLILDEPTNGLDPAGMIEVRHLLLNPAEQGKTIFISSHLPHEIEQFCDRVAVIQQGRVIAEGDVENLLSRTDRLLVRTEQAARAKEVLLALDGIIDIEPGDGVLHVKAPDIRPATINARLVSAGIAVDEPRLELATLENTFLQLTTNEQERKAVASTTTS